MSERRPLLQEIIRRAVDNAAADIFTAIPAKVVKWDASNQRANCQILIKEPDTDEEGNLVTKSVPVVTGVPVQFPGAGGYRVTFPISDGNTTIDSKVAPATTGTLFFSHRSLDKWLTGSGGEVDPEFDHFHAPNDAIFMPGLNPFGSALSSCPTDHATIGADGGVQIHFHQSTIVVGDEASAQFLALANLVKARIDTLQAAHDAHQHTETGTTTSVPTTLIGALAGVAATQAKGT